MIKFLKDRLLSFSLIIVLGFLLLGVDANKLGERITPKSTQCG
ncbi:MAG: hypothetical protein ACFB15_26880 [Cyclobacteriaceae bacterium]